MAEDEDLLRSFTGFHHSGDTDCSLFMYQKCYLEREKPITDDATHSDFASLRMKLEWLSHTRTDCVSEVSQLAQMIEKVFTEKPRTLVKRINRVGKFSRESPLNMRFPKLDIDSLLVIGFSDASFAFNRDLHSKLDIYIYVF